MPVGFSRHKQQAVRAIYSHRNVRSDRLARPFFFCTRRARMNVEAWETTVPGLECRCNVLLCGELFYSWTVTPRGLRGSNHAGYSPRQMGLLRKLVFSLFFPTSRLVRALLHVESHYFGQVNKKMGKLGERRVTLRESVISVSIVHLAH